MALDSGLSTGGFTDCLLQYGASFVYGVDVGYGQVCLYHCFPQILQRQELYFYFCVSCTVACCTVLTDFRILVSVQVAEKIRVHECVSVIERTNLRYLKELPQKVDIVTLDLSFISILTVSHWMWLIVFLRILSVH